MSLFMNIANILTVFRILLVPVFVFFTLIGPENPLYFGVSLFIFVVASLTDAIDGKVARKYDLVTNFGKFMDPLADKILIMAALICLLNLHLIDVLVVIIILSREFLVTSLRLIASSNGKVIAANFFGKLKTVSQIFAIISCLIFAIWPFFDELFWVCQILIVFSTAITVISGVIYLIQNRNFLKDAK